MTFKPDVTQVPRVDVLALLWQIQNVINAGQYPNASPKRLEKLIDDIRGVSAADTEKDTITVQDCLDLAMGEEGSEDDDGMSMFTITFAIYSDITECFTKDTDAYHTGLMRERDGCWND